MTVATSSTLLQAFAWIVLLFPYLTSVFTIIDIDRFRRNSFGLFAKSSSALIVALCIWLGYYTVILAQNLSDGAMVTMSSWPLDVPGFLLYMEAVFVIGALVAFRVTSLRLLNIIEPLRRELEVAKLKLATMERERRATREASSPPRP